MKFRNVLRAFIQVQKSLLSEFGPYRQKAGELINQVKERFNHLVIKLMKYNLKRELIDEKVTFMYGLTP